MISDSDKNTIIKMLRELTEYTDDAIRIQQQTQQNKEREKESTHNLRKVAGLRHTGKYMVAAARSARVTGPEAVRFSEAGNALLGKAPKATNATEAIQELVPVKRYTYPQGFDDIARKDSGIPYHARYSAGDLTKATTVDTKYQSAARNAHEQLRLKSYTGVKQNPNPAQTGMASAMTADNLRRMNSGRHVNVAPKAETLSASSTVSGTIERPSVISRLRSVFTKKPTGMLA